MTKRKHRIWEARAAIWRNLPELPSTFSLCSTPDCGGSGRGGGPCLKCAKKELADSIGGERGKIIADSYIKAIRRLHKCQTIKGRMSANRDIRALNDESEKRQ